MTEFLIKSNLSLLVFLAFYHLVLEREKMHQFNRYFLLLSVVISLAIPFITFEIIKEIPVTAVIESFDIPVQSSADATLKSETTDYTSFLFWSSYLVVTLFLAIRFGKNIWKLRSKSKVNPIVKYRDAQLVLLDEKVLPHTFLNYIFINKNDYENRKIEAELYTHELTHVRQKHTLDILFIEFLKTIFWFNPILIFYKKAIQLNHEFLADENVVNSYNNVPFYQNLLLEKASWNNNFYLASNLNFLVTKKRLIMMTKTTSSKTILFRKIAILPIFTLMIYFLCFETVAQQKNQSPTKNSEAAVVSEVVKLEDYFAGVRFKLYNKKSKSTVTEPSLVFDKSYEELTAEDKEKFKPFLIIPKAPIKKSPTTKEFEEFKNNKKYAVWVDNKNVFNSELDKFSPKDIAYFSGSSILNNARTEKHPQLYQFWLYTHAYFDKNRMGKQSTKYSGEKIELVQDINEEVIAKDVAKYISNEKQKVQNSPSEDGIFNMTDIRPEFPGGIQEFYNFVAQNYNMPDVKDLSGKVFIQFVVEKDGSLTDLKILRDIGHGTGEEAVRVLKLSPKWIAGEQDGQKVRVLYSLPISVRTN